MEWKSACEKIATGAGKIVREVRHFRVCRDGLLDGLTGRGLARR